MSKLSIATGDDLFRMPERSEPLIENVLYRRDIVMLFGDEKAGKSILGQQMSFNLTSGELFLNKYKIANPVNVIYFQTEGKEDETVERRIRMANGIKVDTSKYAHFYKKFFPIDIDEYRDFMIKAIETLSWKPDVLFFDALYMGMAGDLISNKEIRKFIANMSIVAEKFDLTCIIVHHATKEQIDDDGTAIDRGDKSSYGSVFLRAWVDSIFYLKKKGRQTRTLHCDTQRSGKIFRVEELVLIGNPTSNNSDELLHFERNDENDTARQSVLAVMTLKSTVSDKEISVALGLPENSVRRILKLLVSEGKIKEIEKGVYNKNV